MKVTKISEEAEQIEAQGFVLEKYVDGLIYLCRIQGVEVQLGQRVYANGRFGMPEGTLGLVVGFELPFQDGNTTDIIRVWFEGRHSPMKMKFKDL